MNKTRTKTRNITITIGVGDKGILGIRSGPTKSIANTANIINNIGAPLEDIFQYAL